MQHLPNDLGLCRKIGAFVGVRDRYLKKKIYYSDEDFLGKRPRRPSGRVEV